MATLEKRGNSYRIIFRYGKQRFARSLKTSNGRQATTMLYRLEDT